MVKSLIHFIVLRNNYIIILLFLLCPLGANAWDWWPIPMGQHDTCVNELQYFSQINVLSSSGFKAPTWLHGNRNGEIALLPHSGNIRAGIVKPATRPNRWFDYDFGVILSGRIAGTNISTVPHKIEGTGFFSLLYAHARLYVIDITAGIKPLYFGGGDEELTCGSLLLSNNAHPFPRISIGLDRWTAIPGLFGYAEIKGGLTHGWLADNNKIITNVLLHHKYIGGRIGGKLPIKISYEFHHAAQWGGFSSHYGDLGNNWRTYQYVFLAQGGGKLTNEQLNAQGNHILSQTLCVTVNGKKWNLSCYWQDIQEDARPRFIGTGQNKKDGLWGIRFDQTIWPFINACTFEVLHTTDQSGPWHDRDGMVFGGMDNYYNNLIYSQGWTYFGQSICSPLLSPTNSRVWAYHAGIKGDIYGFAYRALCTHARNYGTYNEPTKNHNTAILLEVKKNVPQAWGLDFGLSIASDFGTQNGNTFGAMITISKQGIIKQW